MSSPSRYNATTRRILLSAPAAGAAVSVKPEPGARFIIDFPLASASFLRQGAALKIVFADGGSITILDLSLIQL